VHEPGESHFELLRAFADNKVLDQIFATLVEHGYRTHEFGDFMLIEGPPRTSRLESRPAGKRISLRGAELQAT
jgi:S-adenosylmethionine:tRNA ribosyltransferase-isomerase